MIDFDKKEESTPRSVSMGPSNEDIIRNATMISYELEKYNLYKKLAVKQTHEVDREQLVRIFNSIEEFDTDDYKELYKKIIETIEDFKFKHEMRLRNMSNTMFIPRF